MKPMLFATSGRATRKAREYGGEIRLLRSQGCTFEAIRAALADVGISVSKSTVQREAARINCAPVTVPTLLSAAHSLSTAEPSCKPEERPRDTGVPAGASGKDVADAFFERNHFNPLLPKD
ncbi:hypothetical protein ACS5PN_27045 [Roseateles sp. NT4]|uniref:hypothetical protein n=1 Tax=Roseateles sp. NT4 TaxID=3453715 RepID=UPI003EEAAB25